MTSPRLDSSVVGSGHGMTKNGEELVNNLLIGQLGVGFLFLVSLREALERISPISTCWLLVTEFWHYFYEPLVPGDAPRLLLEAQCVGRQWMHIFVSLWRLSAEFCTFPT